MKRLWVNLIVLVIISLPVILIAEKVMADSQYDTIKDLEAVQDMPVNEQNKLQIPVVSYTSERLRDPFKSLLHKSSAPDTSGEVIEEIVLPSLTVQGVILGSELKQVIMNDKVLKIGDSIEEVNILDIQKDGVEVLFKDKRFHVPAPGSAYRK